jgi:hypothetical protein
MNRSGASNLRYLAAAAVGAGVIATALFLFAPGERKPKGEPNIAALKMVLERSATEVLPPPTVATTEIALDVPADQRDREIDRIVAVATALGGTALRSESTGGALEVLAQIPAGNVAAFRAQVTGKDAFATPEPLPADAPTELVVVKFQGSSSESAASPAPSAATATPANPSA